jgi:NTE family protein
MLIDNQVRALRKRQLIDAYRRQARTGAYWGIRTNIADYGLSDAIAVPHERSLALANTPTRLKALPNDVQEAIIDWGYAVCDAAVRKHVAPGPSPRALPYAR